MLAPKTVLDYNRNSSDVRLFRRESNTRTKTGPQSDWRLVRPLNTQVVKQLRCLHHENTATEKPDVYRKVTDAIVNAIEQGVSNWHMPWHTSGKFTFSPINVASKKPYRGDQYPLPVGRSSNNRGYERGEWGNVTSNGKTAGHRSARARNPTTVESSGSSRTVQPKLRMMAKSIPSPSSRLLFTRGYSVFNAAQVDGYTPKSDAGTLIEEPIESAEAFFGGVTSPCGASAGNRAFYSPADDTITLPPLARSSRPLDYYSTRAHETGHWTAKADRCNRELGKRFGG